MGLTPVEIRHVKLRRRPFGYAVAATDDLLEDIAGSFEDVWRERADLRDEVEELQAQLARHREAEESLRNTLISAERMADEVRGQARREAEVIVAEARSRGRDIVAEAESDRERLHGEIRRLKAIEADLKAEYRAFLLVALDRLDGETDESPRPEMADQAA